MKRTQNTIQKNSLIQKSDSLLIAVSGGPDSMALLCTLHELSKKFQWTLAVAHVNYKLRGKDSDADEALVQSTAESLGLPFYRVRKKSAKNSSEDSLRKIRYDFFESLVQKHDFDVVALAHHQDDQAETVLMRIIRGSGSTGLAGMELKRGIYIRPFLPFSKGEILMYLKARGIPYRLDKSNNENVYFRNKIRNTLLPLLKTYNPRIKKVLANMADTLQSERKSSSLSSVEPFLVSKWKNQVSFSVADWQQLGPASQTALVRDLFKKNGLTYPTKALLTTLTTDINQAPKKGLDKVYSRLKLRINNGMIDIHFKELD